MRDAARRALAGGLMVLVLALGAGGARADEEHLAVEVYNGWGSPTRVQVSGRVLWVEPEEQLAPTAQEGALESLARNIRAMESDEVEGAAVRVVLGARTVETRADAEGVFQVELADLDPPLPSGPHAVTVTAADPEQPTQTATAQGTVHVLGADVRTVLVSDVDDTVVQSEVTRKLMLLANTFLKNAATARPVPGKAKLYQLLAAGTPPPPVFYVSGSPINLHERIRYYLEVHGFPAGPILLKNYGWLHHEHDPLFAQEEYKIGRIGALIEEFPGVEFLCFGDDGEKDPEVYAALAERYPGRIRHISIRVVTEAAADAPRFAGMAAGADAFQEARALVRAGRLTEAQALDVARAALGTHPLPDGFGLDSALPAEAATTAPEVAVESRDLWAQFCAFLSANWLTWLRMLGVLALSVVGGGVLGAVLGGIGGLAVFLLVRRRGWTRTEMAWYRWVGWLMPLWFVLAGGGGGGIAGAWLGGGHSLRGMILEDRVVQKTLLHLTVAVLSMRAEQGADATTTAADIEGRAAQEQARLDRALERTVDQRLDTFVRQRQGGGLLERWTVGFLGRATLGMVQDRPEYEALRGLALLSEEERDALRAGSATAAVTKGYAALQPLLVELERSLAGSVRSMAWGSAATAGATALLAMLAPIGLLRLLDAWVRRRRARTGDQTR